MFFLLTECLLSSALNSSNACALSSLSSNCKRKENFRFSYFILVNSKMNYMCIFLEGGIINMIEKKKATHKWNLTILPMYHILSHCNGCFRIVISDFWKSTHLLNQKSDISYWIPPSLRALWKRPYIKDVGNFFLIYDPSLPHVGSFCILNVGNFDSFLTPTPLLTAEVFYVWPLA